MLQPTTIGSAAVIFVPLSVSTLTVCIRRSYEQLNVAVLMAEFTGVDPILIQKKDLISGKLKILGTTIKVVTHF